MPFDTVDEINAEIEKNCKTQYPTLDSIVTSDLVANAGASNAMLCLHACIEMIINSDKTIGRELFKPLQDTLLKYESLVKPDAGFFAKTMARVQIAKDYMSGNLAPELSTALGPCFLLLEKVEKSGSIEVTLKIQLYSKMYLLIRKLGGLATKDDKQLVNTLCDKLTKCFEAIVPKPVLEEKIDISQLNFVVVSDGFWKSIMELDELLPVLQKLKAKRLEVIFEGRTRDFFGVGSSRTEIAAAKRALEPLEKAIAYIQQIKESGSMQIQPDDKLRELLGVVSKRTKVVTGCFWHEPGNFNKLQKYLNKYNITVPAESEAKLSS